MPRKKAIVKEKQSPKDPSPKQTKKPVKKEAEVEIIQTTVLAPEQEPGIVLENLKPKKKTYIYAVGRRKTAVARIRLHKGGSGKIIVNDQEYTQYFPTFELQQIITASLNSVGQNDKLDVTAKVSGGGKKGQAESIRHGLAGALVKLNPNFRKNLRKSGFLTRDSRRKERKKPGLKRARRAPQWQKR